MTEMPRNVCCDPDYFGTDVVIYFSALTTERYEVMDSDDQGFIRDVYFHLKFCELCSEGFERLKMIGFEDTIEGKSHRQMMEENEHRLSSLL